MKNLLAIYLILCAYELAAQIPGTVTVTGPIAPPATNSPFAATDTRWQKGGYNTWATNISQLTDVNWLPDARLQVGMVHKLQNGGAYELGTNSTTWSALPWWRPEWFGARMNDASFDNAPAIAACIVQSTLAGAGTQLGNGTYYIAQDIGPLVTPSLNYALYSVRVEGSAPGAYQDVTEVATGTTIRRTVDTTMFTWAGTDSQIRRGTVFNNVQWHGNRFTNAMVQLIFTKDHYWLNCGFNFSAGAAIVGIGWWDSQFQNPTFSFTGATNGTIGTIHLVNTNASYPTAYAASGNNNLIFSNARMEPANVALFIDGTGGDVPANKIHLDGKIENHYQQTPSFKLKRASGVSFGGGRSFIAYGDNGLNFHPDPVNLFEIEDNVQLRLENFNIEYAGTANPTNKLIDSYIRIAGSDTVVFDNIFANAFYTNSAPTNAFVEIMATNYPLNLNVFLGKFGYYVGDGPGAVTTGTNSYAYGKMPTQRLLVTNLFEVAGSVGFNPRSGIADTVESYVPINIRTNDALIDGGNLTVFYNGATGGTLTAKQITGSSSGDQKVYLNSTTPGGIVGFSANITNGYKGELSYNDAGQAWQLIDKAFAPRIQVTDAGAINLNNSTVITGNATVVGAAVIDGGSGANLIYRATSGASQNFNQTYNRSGVQIWDMVVDGNNQFRFIGTNNSPVLSLSPSYGVTIGTNGVAVSKLRMGRATLVGGTVTVSDANVTANSNIFLTSNVDGGTPGWLRVSARTASTSFTITSSSGTDTSTVAWTMYEP